MPFANKSSFKGGGLDPIQGNQVDQGQIENIKELGYMVTPISGDATILNKTIPVSKELIPGVAVGGYQDGVGNFYILDDNNIVNKVDKFAPDLTNDFIIPPSTIVPIRPDGTIPPAILPPTIPPRIPPVVPPTKPPAPQPPNFGSGKIYTIFEVGDVVANQQETITRALWSNNVGNLTSFFTSSNQTTTQQRYYYEIFNSASAECGAEAQFSVAYGHKAGSGSADEGGQVNDTPSRAIYGQYRLLCLDGDTARFTFDGSTTDQIYAINVNRARMREFLDEGNMEVNIAHLSGSEWIEGGDLMTAYTGSNVTLGGQGQVLRLIDDSGINAATITDAGEVYDMVSG